MVEVDSSDEVLQAGAAIRGTPPSYVADTNNHALRVVDLTTRSVRTVDLG
jgi:hypothetical protein